jgi:succinoglycan biosynthesis transport protein ExoP
MNSSDETFPENRKVDLFTESTRREAGVRPLRPFSQMISVKSSSPFELSDTQADAGFQDFLDILCRQRWKLLSLIALALSATAFITSRVTPLYESNVSINVERRGNGVVGTEASTPTVTEMDQIMTTQVERIESDPVLRPVAEKYDLLGIEHQFRWLDDAERERLRRSRTSLKRLKVTRVSNTSILRISYRAPDPQLAADIVTMIAKSYVEHAFDSREQSNSAVLTLVGHQLTDLRERMNISDNALAAFAKDLNYIDPDQRVNALSSRLLQLNTDYTAAQSERLHKESLYNASKSGDVAGAQLSTQSAMLEGAIARLNQTKGEFAKISTVFGAGHPEYQKASREMNEMQRQFDEIRTNTVERIAADYRQAAEREQMAGDLLAKTRSEVDALTTKSFEYQRLRNEAENYRKLYDDLERITREQVINRGFQEAILQIVDPARPSAKQASPNMILNLIAAFLLSAMLGVGGVAVLDTLDGRVRTPADAAKLPNVEVIASLPKFAPWGKSARVAGTTPRNRRTTLLLEYQESIRVLRNSIFMTALDHPMRSLVITSPSVGENASLVSANLAFSYAGLGRKVLLIDADLREPSLHIIFEKTTSIGLAEVLAGQTPWRETLIQVAREELFLMPAGVMTDQSPDLMSTGMQRFLHDVSKDFDLVLILAPPMLAAAESAPVAGAADAVLITTKARSTESKDITATYSLLSRARANIIGLVLSDVRGLIKPRLHSPIQKAS